MAKLLCDLQLAFVLQDRRVSQPVRDLCGRGQGLGGSDRSVSMAGAGWAVRPSPGRQRKQGCSRLPCLRCGLGKWSKSPGAFAAVLVGQSFMYRDDPAELAMTLFQEAGDAFFRSE